MILPSRFIAHLSAHWITILIEFIVANMSACCTGLMAKTTTPHTAQPCGAFSNTIPTGALVDYDPDKAALADLDDVLTAGGQLQVGIADLLTIQLDPALINGAAGLAIGFG